MTGHASLFALTILPTSGSLPPITNAFTTLPPITSPLSKATFNLGCPTLTSLIQFTTVLAQITGEYGMENREVLRSLEETGSSRAWEMTSASGYVQ